MTDALIRRAVRSTSRTRLFDAAVAALERLDAGPPGAFSVLMYHRIGDPAETSALDPRLISATPESFEDQVAYLAARKHVVGLDDLLEARSGRARLPSGAVLVTFDDAYRDFGSEAWPILLRHGVPATLFVPTAYPDHAERAFWWDRVYAAISKTRERELRLPWATFPLSDAAERMQALLWVDRSVRSTSHGRALALVAMVEAVLDTPPSRGQVLTWNELRRLAAEGVAVAAHTRTHPLLTHVAAASAENEIAGSAADLERELGGAAAPAFAYPGGCHDEAVVASVRAAGFALAFTTCRGGEDAAGADWLRLHRINVGVHTPLAAIRAQLVPTVMRRRGHPIGAPA